MDELKYKKMNYFIDEDERISFEILFESESDSNSIWDCQNFDPDELIDLIDHRTALREYQIKHILEAPQKQFLIDFIIEDLNEKLHQIITIDFEDIIIRKKQDQDTQRALESYNDQIFSSPEIEN